MNPIAAPSVPDVTDQWIDARRAHLIGELPSIRRTRIPRGKAAMFVGTGLIASASAATTGLVLVGSTSAFAGWTSSPTTPAPGQTATAQASCQSAITNGIAAAQQGGEVQKASGGPGNAVLQPPVIVDTRGPFTAMIFADSQNASLCVTGPDFTSVGAPAYPRTEVTPGGVVFGRVGFTYRDGQPFTLAEGNVGAGVSGVSLTLDDGTQVETTVANGWFLAWWPGVQRGIRSAQSISPAGVQSVVVNSAGPTPPSGATKGR